MFDLVRYRRLLRTYFLAVGVLILLKGGICNPLYLYLSSDILWMTSPWVAVLEILMTVTNYLFYWFSFAAVIWCGVRFSMPHAARLFGGYAGAVVVGYLVSLLGGYSVEGFPRWSQFVSKELGGLIFSVMMDLLQGGLTLLILFLALRRMAPEALPKGRRLYECRLPFVTLLPGGNRVQRVALWVGLIPAGIRFLLRLYYDIFFYGAPVDAWDLLVMLFSYCSDLLCAVVGYFALLLLLNRFSREEAAAKAVFEAPMDGEN